jgi:hypothetical protein
VSRTVLGLLATIVVLSLLVSAGPTLVALVEAAVPLAVAVGVVAAVLRLVWVFADRYR